MRIKSKTAKTWIAASAGLGLLGVLIVAQQQWEIAQEPTTREAQVGTKAKEPSRETTIRVDSQSPTETRPALRHEASSSASHTNERKPRETETRSDGGGSYHTAEPKLATIPQNVGGVGSEKDRTRNPEHSALTMPAAPPVGVQLAPEVELPLAAMPIDFETNEVTARMLEIIVDDYYRNLTAGVLQDEEGIQTTRYLEENGDTTILVRNGPAAEAARQWADWRFRTIFGKEAFNRMSMRSNLEARLPVTDTD